MKTPNTKHRYTTMLTGIFIGGILLTSCSSAEQETPAPTSPSVNTTTPANEPSPSSPTSVPEEPDESTQPLGDFSLDRQQSEDWPDFGDTDAVYPTHIRAATHPGFERVVIEHTGTGTPSYYAQYTADPVEPGRGQPIDTGDDAYLEIVLSGTASFQDVDTEKMLDNGYERTDFDTEAVSTVVSFVPWEATSTYIIGLDEQRPYAVTILENPVRVVIDIEH